MCSHHSEVTLNLALEEVPIEVYTVTWNTEQQNNGIWNNSSVHVV